MRIGYFLEDIAHERFMCALVGRVAVDRGVAKESIEHDVRNASHGVGAAITSFRRFLIDHGKGKESAFDILVVAVDGNCVGHNRKRDELRRLTESAGYGGAVVYAVPDPHIEYWYLTDPAACMEALESPSQPQCPSYKCEKDVYKEALRKVIEEGGVDSAFGGTEYGAAIVAKMNFYNAEQNDPRNSLKTFLSDLRSALVPFVLTRPVD